MRYRINEVFRSPQGEGKRQGEDSVFVRFTGCNLRCAMEPGPRSPGGFDCDTEFMSGYWWGTRELVGYVNRIAMNDGSLEGQAAVAGAISGTPTAVEHEVLARMADNRCKWVVLTGGEPTLQMDAELCQALHDAGFKIQVETNGTREFPTEWVDFVTVSPKVAEHAIRMRKATEVKYVRGHGQAIPRTVVDAQYKLISPAFLGDRPDPLAMSWCKHLVEQHPDWELSVQMHKAWGVR